jgi:hypothetical protein
MVVMTVDGGDDGEVQGAQVNSMGGFPLEG